MTTQRRRNPLRDYLVVLWFIAAATVAIAHRQVPEATWLMVHLVMLGALTHSMLVWSHHFTRTLLKIRHTPRQESAQSARLLMLAAGSALVFTGVPLGWWWVALVGAVVVVIAVLWHGIALAGHLRRALPGRFRVTVRYYIVAAAWLPIGATFGILLARGLGETWHARLLVAHTMSMLLGWVGLTVVGTLITFWPTVLRARMDDRAESAARRVLVPLAVTTVIIVGAALAGLTPVALAGLAGYLALVVWWGRTLIRPLRAKPLREFAPASIGAALVWFIVALALTGWTVLTSTDARLATTYPGLAAYWVAGFALQILTGALSYLLPSVIGGGPRVVRAGARWFDRWATVRLTVINGGLLIWLFQPPSWVRVTVSAAVLIAFVTFIPLMLRGVMASVQERRRAAAGEPADDATRTPALTASGLSAGIAALAVVASIGLAVAPESGSADVASDVTPTGRTVEVSIDAAHMRFTPNTIEADAGDHVIVTVTNSDPSQVHDLTLGGRTTPRLDPGQSATLDLGIVSTSEEGWCTIVGHRQQGMTLHLQVAGDAASHEQTAQDASTNASMRFDPDTELTDVVDPTAPAPSDEVDHRFKITATDETVEVAPGVWQQRWPFTGGPQGSVDTGGHLGPTIRGKVGDTFEVTFVNHGTMAHSLDFHASNVAPDGPMRTLAPGEELVYRFTAKRAGAWLYHCGTAPMTAHLAAGMHGAVIIDPPGLERVDKEYVLVQSEVYMEPGTGTSPDTAAPVDATRAHDGTVDFVVWNGIADQYLQHPLTAAVGERVRIWVVAAGPNRGTDFHIVGAQFDTTYSEGAYHLKRGRDAFGTTDGGSQTLHVGASQGGFVETVFPEAGHYTMVDHAFMNAERGARGTVHVTR